MAYLSLNVLLCCTFVRCSTPFCSKKYLLSLYGFEVFSRSTQRDNRKLYSLRQSEGREGEIEAY